MIPSLPHPAARRLAAGLALSSGALAVVPERSVAQLCDDGVVREITVERIEPFSGDAVGENARLGWWFRLMNTLHVRTLESTVRWELLFGEDECLDPVLLAESERSLRSLSYIGDASVTAETAEDGAQSVRVRTEDSWAVSGGVSLSFDDGVSITGVSGNAKNVLGTGTRVSLFRNVFRERERKGYLVRQPNLFGSRVDATAHGGRTLAGRTFSQSLLRPYSGEVGTNAVRQSYHRRDDYFAYSTDPGLGFTQAYVRYDTESFDATYQRRFGAATGTRLILGAGLSRESVAFPSGSSGVRVVRNRDFDAPEAADATVVEEVAGQMVPWAGNRVNLTIGVRRVTFQRRTGLDAIAAAQDVVLGGELLVTAAPAVSGDRGDWLFRTQGALAAGRGALHANLTLQIQARRSELADGGSRWRDAMLEVDGTSYWIQGARTSLFSRIALSGAANMERPFQLTLGGREALRGYGNDSFPGGRRVIATVEQRVALPELSTGFADVALSAFVDVGRMWEGSVPYGADSGWRASAGGGFRLGLPGGGVDVVRVDFGMPLSGEDGGRGVAFRISAEILGLLDRRMWPNQMERSRWHGVDADLATRPLRPLARN